MISPCKIWSKSLHITRFIFHLQVYIWCVETCAFALGGHKTPGELRKQLHRHLVKGVFIKINFLDQNSLEFRRWPCPVWRKTWWVKRGVWCRSMWNQGKGGESSNVQNGAQIGQKKRAARFYSAWFSSITKNSLLAARRRTFTWSVARKGNWAALGLDLNAHIRSISRFWVVQVSGQFPNFYLRNFVCWNSDLCNFVGWDSVMKKTFPSLTGPRAKVLPQGKLSVLTWKL